ncbi:MAG: ABC transporter ATP-binding protein [Proteobacteria bacterium]|jgi:ATP-binding cassette subfamily B multidrug efflux pump|nr:ABC transporter ATP-binding protein [Pseudomonadota bacterium]MDA1301559.1 ABC transporter ATP-binding protein [Pseudomonadota bacterium]
MTSFTATGPRRERSSFKDIAHLKNLGVYFRRYALVLSISIIGMLVANIMSAIVPLLMKTGIDSLADPEIEPDIIMPAIAIAVIVIVRFFVFVVTRRIMRRVSIAVAYDLRKRMFNHIQYQGAAFFTRFSTGDLMSRTINDISMIRMVVSFGWVNIISFFFTVGTGIYFMATLSPSLTAWVVLPLPFVAVIGFMMARAMFPYYRDQQEAMAAVTEFTQENLNGIRTIQAMAQEEQEIKRFSAISTHYAQMVYRATRFNAWLGLVMPVLTSASPVIIIFYGGQLVLSGEITIGTFTAFFSYMMMVVWPVRMIGMSLSMFTAAAAGTQRIFEVLDFEQEIKDSPIADLPTRTAGHLAFRNLTFSHPGAARPTIDGVSVDIKAGETIAILGRIGAGKSTLLRAVVRLIDTPRDTVFIDGIDVCDYPVQELRRIATMIPQDPFLFSTTLRENLTYDDPGRDDAELWDAADAAGLASTVHEMTHGLDTIVGERGQTLSGGQKQRATLARGLVRNAPILLLDDCFSAVDTETEDRILSGLARLRNDKTTVLISHRVSTARHADRILVIDNGHIAESGTHDELIELGGYYADLAAVQSDQDEDRARKSRLLSNLDDSDVIEQAVEVTS